MRRHYENKHDYDVLKCDAHDVDPGYPDGVLCPECGEHFQSQNILIQHILTHHSKTTGEQCLYCSFRYNDILAHIEDCHMSERYPLPSNPPLTNILWLWTAAAWKYLGAGTLMAEDAALSSRCRLTGIHVRSLVWKALNMVVMQSDVVHLVKICVLRQPHLMKCSKGKL